VIYQYSTRNVSLWPWM